MTWQGLATGGLMTQMSGLHERRLDHVAGVLKSTGARRVLDLGCGSGSLLYRLLAEAQFEEVVGLEQSGASLAQARTNLAEYLQKPHPRLKLLCGSYTDKNPQLVGFDVAAMVETIEHVEPASLSKVELAVFGYCRPQRLYMTTPNSEYNPLFDLPPGVFREPDHKFEWSRLKFQQWARGVANRQSYRVSFSGIGDYHPELGPPTQTALFQRAT
jgi:small RNA 2'-O-methyltransferase